MLVVLIPGIFFVTLKIYFRNFFCISSLTIFPIASLCIPETRIILASPSPLLLRLAHFTHGHHPHFPPHRHWPAGLSVPSLCLCACTGAVLPP